MALYKVRKGNEEFSIQPNMIEAYSMSGYTILNSEGNVVEDIKKEVESIAKESEAASNGQS